ncbi:zinc-ribbon domain-containing protein [Thermoanaerobacterium sp. DL9XJH110]|uniref:zinc-ribbon domain-containing protein n=1 Tax=Thermoanaerobacterium sp. DL9XJH110 TaxID=3386643 RepID=UPI003BB7D4A3
MSFDLNDFFGDEPFTVQCPNCKKTFKIKFGKVLKNHSVIQCPACQAKFELQHDSTTEKSIRDSNKALKDFNKSLKDLEKTLKKFR